MSILNGVLEAAKAAKLLTREGFLKQIEKWWAVAKIDPQHRTAVLKVARQIQMNKPEYMKLQNLTKVPWYFCGLLHNKECSLSFLKVLHNGEYLTDVNRYGTRLVPKKRGKGKGWNWHEAAVDALFFDKMHLKDLSTIPKMLDAGERYNGLGYRGRGVPSIYLWSHTNISTEKGKFAGDHNWDSNAPSKNPGIAAILLGLMELGEDLGQGLKEPTTPSEIDKVKDDPSVVLKHLASQAGVLAPMERMLEFSKTIDFNKGPNYWGVIDFSKHSFTKRFYIFSVKDKSCTSYLVAHGKGSDRDHNGYADIFSNVNGSNCSSLGIYQAMETYQGKHGLSLRLDGKEASNSRARDRAIVIHGADYVSQSYVNTNGKCGRSEGCPAVDMAVYRDVIDKLKGGSLIIAVA